MMVMPKRASSTKTRAVKKSPAKRSRQRPALPGKEFRIWCDNYGHGARAHVAREAHVRYQTVHDIYQGTRVATVATARKIEKVTKGEVPWTSLVG